MTINTDHNISDTQLAATIVADAATAAAKAVTDTATAVTKANGDVSNKDLYDVINNFRIECRLAFVSKDEFIARMKPLEAFVYGMSGFILTAVLGAVVAIVLARVYPQQSQSFAQAVTPIVQMITATPQKNINSN